MNKQTGFATIILAALVFVSVAASQMFTGCAWTESHQGQIRAVGSVALDQIAKESFRIAARTLLDEAQSGFSADVGYTLQKNARDSLSIIVSSDSLKAYLNAWNNAATAKFAKLVPPDLSKPDAQKVALIIADSQAAALAK